MWRLLFLSAFWLDIAYCRLFLGEGLGYISPKIWPPVVLTPKRTIIARKHIVWALKREDRSSGSIWAQDREKGKGSQKRHKVVIFCLFEVNPPGVTIETKICMVGHLPDIITFAKLQDDIFRGYDFTGVGVEFPIFLLIFAGVQQCSTTSLPVIEPSSLRVVWGI